MLRRLILILFAATFLAKFITLGAMPFSHDETLYAEMIAEEAESPSFLPTYLGYSAPWKPGLSFIAQSLFLPLTSALFSSPEYVYRFPVLIFSLINAYLFYLLAKRFYGEDAALASSFLFYCSFSSFYIESRLLMEPFMLMAILLSLVFYTKKEMPAEKRFALGGLFALLAALTKSVIALLIPLLAVIYIFQNEKKNLANPAFLLSLLAVPAGLAIFWLALSQLGLAQDIFFTDTGKMFIYDYSTAMAMNIFIGMLMAVTLMLPIYAAAIRSFLSRWKENLMFSAWFALLFVLLFLGQRPWYYYYVTPPIALFASFLLLGKNMRIDDFSFFALLIVALLTLSVAVFSNWNPAYQDYLPESKEIGLSLSGKGNVLFIGKYETNTVSIIYKMLDERKNSGAYRDFGYILFDYRENNATESSVSDFVEDYWRSDYDVEENNFAGIFWQGKIFRKNTSIAQFDYIVLSPPMENLSLPGYSVLFQGNSSTIYIRDSWASSSPRP